LSAISQLQPAAVPLPADLGEQVRRALAEDVGDGDVTADLIAESARAEGGVVSRERAVLCGTAWFDEVFAQLDARVCVTWRATDGAQTAPDQQLCHLEGPARALLTGERTALNFLQGLSGTATLARRYAEAVSGTATRVLDTRKTIPGLRSAQKYAVRCGGCHNHRLGLYDAVLVKENHILAAGSIAAAITRSRAAHPTLPIEVEVEDLDELAQALEERADIVLLDNFSPDMVRAAVAAATGRAKLEVSGGLDLDSVRELARTGVDYISVGELTKNVRAVDLSMRFAAAPSSP
jgi:nicotinate-nucleotide pyrophosphorylase (carboxylating)